MKKIKNPTTLIIIAIFISFLMFNVNILQAEDLISGETEGLMDDQETAFLEEAGLGKDVTIGDVVSAVIKLFLSFLGIIFVILIIYAGFMWMTSAGNEEKITTAKKTMISAIIGLAIVLAAYAITYFVIDELLEATKGGSGLD